jgi:hypothetical protein
LLYFFWSAGSATAGQLPLQDGCQQLEPGAFTPGKSRKLLQTNVLAKPDCTISKRGPFA